MCADVIDVLTKEAEERKKIAQESANKPLPQNIEEIVSTSVIYNIDPDLLPYEDLEAEMFIDKLAKLYSLKFKKPKYDPNLLLSIGINPADLTEDKLLKILLTQSPQLAFENGRYSTGTNKFVPISSVDMNDQYILVKVKGVIEIAEDVVAQIFNLFWDCSNSEKTWDSEEIQNSIALKSYRTRTTVNLGSKSNSFLNPSIVDHLDDNLTSNKIYGAKMCQYSKHDNFEPPSGIVASWNMEDIDLKFHMFNPMNGRSETSSVIIRTTSKDNRGRGVFDIESELPYESHIELVTSLANALKVV